MRTVGAVSVQSIINSSRSERRKSESRRRWLCRLFISVSFLVVLCYDIVFQNIFPSQASVSGGCVSKFIDSLFHDNICLLSITGSLRRSVHVAEKHVCLLFVLHSMSSSGATFLGGDDGVASGVSWEDEISDVDRYQQAAAQYFAGRGDDGVDEENPSSAAYVAQGSVMYSYHAGSELRFGTANAMGKLTGVTPVG